MRPFCKPHPRLPHGLAPCMKPGCGVAKRRIRSLRVGRDEADRHGGICGGSRALSRGRQNCRRAIVIRNHAGAGRAAGYAPSAPGLPSADPASRHALLSGAGCLSSLFPGPGRGARLQRPIRAGISAERHRDRAANELPLDPRLTIASNLGLSGKPSLRRNRIRARCIHLSGAGIQSSFTSPSPGIDLRRGEAVAVRRKHRAART